PHCTSHSPHLISLFLYIFSFFFYCSRHHQALHSFPTRRSSDLSENQFYLAITKRFANHHPSIPRLVVQCRSRRYVGRLESIHGRSEEHTSELQSRFDLVCRLLLEKKK